MIQRFRYPSPDYVPEPTEAWGAWKHEGRPESVLEFCDAMIASFNRVAEIDRDALWVFCIEGYLAKQMELRDRFPHLKPRITDLFEEP